MARTKEFQNGSAKDQDLSANMGTPYTYHSGYVPIDGQHVVSADSMAPGPTGSDRRMPGSKDETSTPNGSALNTFQNEQSYNTYRNV